MLDDAANVVEGGVRQAAVLIPREQRLTFFLQRLMHVHSAAVVADDGFRHESKGFAVTVRHVLQGVLENLHLVGFLGERVCRHIDFALTGSRDFVMMHFEPQTHFFAGHRHRGAYVLLRIDRRHREVAALHRGAMRLVALFVSFAGVPRTLVGVHFVRASVHAGADGDVVENEEFVFWAEKRRVGDPGGLEISLGTFCERTRVALVALHGHGFDNVATQIDRGLFVERIDDRSSRIRHQDHVRLIDSLPTGDRRAVEHFAILEKALVHQARGYSDVVFLADCVGKAEIGELRLFFFDQFQNIGGSHLRPRVRLISPRARPG
jgi:hypothetical protein